MYKRKYEKIPLVFDDIFTTSTDKVLATSPVDVDKKLISENIEKTTYKNPYNASILNGGSTCLDSRAAKFAVEVTLNYPRCPGWVNLPTAKQNALYLKRLYEIKSCLGTDVLKLHSYGYEVSGDGHMHCHAYFICESDKRHFPLGVVGDIVKCYLNALPKKYQAYKSACMYKVYKRYMGPGVCVQYQGLETDDEKKRSEFWINYIKKFS